MARSNEYLERRCAINEAVLVDLGDLLGAHFPILGPYLNRIGAAWTDAIVKLDADIPLESECGDPK